MKDQLIGQIVLHPTGPPFDISSLIGALEK